MLQTMSVDELRINLTALGLSLGVQHKIIKGLEQNANAAKKSAEIKAANDQMAAAVAKQERDDIRMQALRAKLERLQHVIKRRGVPPHMSCPITQEIMVDPVMAADGNTYERKAIRDWFENNNTSPLTGCELKDKTLHENRAVRDIVQWFVEECERAGEDPNELA